MIDPYDHLTIDAGEEDTTYFLYPDDRPEVVFTDDLLREWEEPTG